MSRIVIAAGMIATATSLSACHHDWLRAEAFTERIRCGMTEPQIRSLAKDFGVSGDRIWQQPDTSHVLTVAARDLDFVDILLEQGRVVGVQRGNYVAFVPTMQFGPIRMLCGRAPLAARSLRDYDELASHPANSGDERHHETRPPNQVANPCTSSGVTPSPAAR